MSPQMGVHTTGGTSEVIQEEQRVWLRNLLF